jgi:hypothetical protein
VTSVLSLRIVSSVTVDPTSSMHLVKKSEIKPENAKDGIQKMIQSGFIKSVSRRTKAEAARALRSSQNHPQPPRHEPGPHSTGRKNQKPTAQKTKTTRHEHDDEWYDDYFVRSMLCVYSCCVVSLRQKMPAVHSLSLIAIRIILIFLNVLSHAPGLS